MDTMNMTAHGRFHTAPAVTSEKMQDRVKENPLESLELDDLDRHVKDLFSRVFEGRDSVTEEELIVGARLARSNYANHERDPSEESDRVDPKPFTPSIDTVKYLLKDHDWRALEIQKSKKFWKEPKALLVTLAICCLAPWVQGWNQAANGNLGWPKEFHFNANVIKESDHDIWEFGVVNAVMWFAAMIGPMLVDVICNTTSVAGRRGSVLVAAILSLVGTVGSSRSQTWRQLLGWRIVLGIGIGAKASIVPIWESEVLPPAKRGRVLVSWQVFVAIGLLTGNGATYYFGNSETQWRYQILTGAIPALILLVLVYIGCESPRWLVVHSKYVEAFETLVQLRKERLLAAEEFCYTYFQIQAERAAARRKIEPDFSVYQRRIGYLERLWQLLTLVRNRRALLATIIVMMTQHLSGINVFAFLGTNFYTAVNLDQDQTIEARARNNLKLSLYFSAFTVIASSIAYFLVEPLPVDSSLDDLYTSDPGSHQSTSAKETAKQQKRVNELKRLLRGRRRLLLISLASGTLMLGGLTGVLSLPDYSASKAPAVAALVILLAVCYSPGAGAVPFLYSAEVWPNEARDVGMSVGVFVNFFGAGMLTLVAPLGLLWSPVKLFAIFTGLSTFGFLLVYFFVPCTDKAVSLEEMSAIFEHSLFRHARNQARQVLPFKNRKSKKKAAQMTYTGPIVQHPHLNYHVPQVYHQPYHHTSPAQYASHGYPPQENYYEVPPIPQPYYSASDPGRSSPYGVQPLDLQQTFYQSPRAPQPQYQNSSPHHSLHNFGPQDRFGGAPAM